MADRTRGKKVELSSEEVKAQLIAAAKHHFALHGFQGASLKDIAKDSHVASSLINYHFGDKEGLFKACMEPFAQGHMEIIQRILSHPHNRDELRVRIELFVEEFMSSVMRDRDAFEIVDRELRSGNPLIFEIFEKTMLVAYKSVVNFFKEAQEAGLLEESMDPLLVAALLFTSCCDVMRKQDLGKRFFNISLGAPEWRKELVRHIVHLFMSGVIK